ncbi:hypothetical protein PILCRDRAFT_15902 [Piloderma croceum F 1598]|uniref:Amidohydrolase-related domain-containing protein n=1 Tax=Piloderma croceum (strain F 1598) TaxID=765440 RepID=A0A0C3B5W1_PILCF|nr:hypothetical protein PILCRDRAFT_15902 [Piloderma croceum F 1598]
MDREVPEDNLEPSASDSIQATEQLIDYIQNLTHASDSPLIHPIITPRFSISCTPELLRGLRTPLCTYKLIFPKTLTNGVAPIGKYLDAGTKVGLGTDVSGRFNPSILNAIQHASIASKVISLQHNLSDPLKPGYNNHKLSVATLVYLATLGGAQVCGLEDDIGSFALGKSFDALLVKVSSEAGNPDLYPGGKEDVDKYL